MAYRLTALFATCLLAAGCGGGNGGTTTTTGGTTTGAGTTTGGTTGGRAKYKAGADCAANTDCLSGFCGVNGAGKCCFASCGDAGGSCDATSCDETGACAFPKSGVQCQPDSCASASLTSYQCDGTGNCQAQGSNACAGDYGCTSDGTACASTCTSSSECASGFVCNTGHCVVQKTIGTCTANDNCFSGRCGLSGTGNCCTGTPCSGSDPTCGPSGCDPVNGACMYPDAGTPCGSVLASCSAGVEQQASNCDGQGVCGTPTPGPCSPFICGANACLNSCTDASSCAAGDYCDTNHGSCCRAFANGSSVTVDATAGNDAVACCSVPGYPPCQTLTQAMKQIDVAQAQNVTLNAVTRVGRTWNPPGEIYPIVLGWGVELSAPSVFFYDGADGGSFPEIFDVQAVSKNDKVGYASIVGTAKKQVVIGDDEFTDQSSDAQMILIGAGNTLYIANAQLDSNEDVEGNAITIAAGGSLVIAQDQSAAVTGTVTIGYANINNRQGFWGYGGIVCQSSKTAGCTISDTPLVDGGSTLVIQGQAGVDIDAEDFAKVTLKGAPQIGIPAGAVGFDVCNDKVEGEDGFGPNFLTAAVLLNGNATMDFENGTIQCASADGIDLQASANGTPTLTLVNSTIENTNTALNVLAGSATVSGSTIQFNANGVAQATDGKNEGSVDLNGGDAGNTIICSDSTELSGEIVNFVVGSCVSNSTSNGLNADNVTWDTSGPDNFRCDSTLETCVCQLPSCTMDTTDGGVDGMDAVEIGDAGAITTTGNQLSSVACDYPVSEGGCNPPCQGLNICCPLGKPVCVPIQLCLF